MGLEAEAAELEQLLLHATPESQAEREFKEFDAIPGSAAPQAAQVGIRPQKAASADPYFGTAAEGVFAGECLGGVAEAALKAAAMEDESATELFGIAEQTPRSSRTL